MAPDGIITGANSYPAPSYLPPEEEPEVIKEWRAKRTTEIERRDRVSADHKATTVAEARQAIDDFYDGYNDKKEKNIAQSRREAAEFLESRDNTTAGGTSWERISKLVDLSGKGTTGNAAGKERFRELLINLRKDEKAPGASGL
jgi:Clathrin light chain